MQRLCSLIYILLLLVSVVAFAEPSSVTTAIQVSAQEGATHIDNFNDDSELGGQSVSLNYSSGLLSGGVRLRARAQNTIRDLQNYLIVHRDGREEALSNQFSGVEQYITGGLDYGWRNWVMSLDVGQSVSDTPLAQRQASLAVGYNSFAYGASFEMKLVQGRQEQPVSYFVHPETFAPTPTPVILHPHVFHMSYNQILSQHLQSKLVLKYGRRPEDRPDHFGLGMRSSYALSRALALHLGFEQISENRSQSLQATQGYMDLQSCDVGVAIEPTYGFLIRAAVATQIERESERGRVPSQVIGTDSVNLAFEYRRNRLSLALRGNLQETNTDFKSNQVYGAATWEI